MTPSWPLPNKYPFLSEIKMLTYPQTPREGDQDHIARVGVPTTCLVACLM